LLHLEVGVVSCHRSHRDPLVGSDLHAGRVDLHHDRSLGARLIIGALAGLIKPAKQDLGVLILGLGLVGSLIGGLIAQLFGAGDAA
jgi:hypothetical protein